MGRKSQYAPPRNEWQKQVNPAFIKYWSAQRAMRLSGEAKDENKRAAAFRRAFQDLSIASRLLNQERKKVSKPIGAQLMKEIYRPLDGEGEFQGATPGMAYAVNPESNSFFRYLVFLKLGMTFRRLIMEIEKDKRAYSKLLKVHHDFSRFAIGKLPIDRLKLKFNWNHFAIVLDGLDFGFNNLNEIELASCLDAICPCANPHSEEYFKKLRARIRNACEKFVPDATSWRPGN
jgi:hypothetical protein